MSFLPTFVLLGVVAFGFGLTSPETGIPALIIFVVYGSFINNEAKPTVRRMCALGGLVVVSMVMTQITLWVFLPAPMPIMRGIIAGFFMSPSLLMFTDALRDYARKST